jgi:hypothetical protein
MEVLYWFCKFLIVFCLITISNPVYDLAGWWGAVSLFLLVLWAWNFFDNKLKKIQLHNIHTRLPVLKDLDLGELVTLELKNGMIFSNFLFSSYNEHDITIYSQIDLEQIMQGKNNERSIRIKKVISIQKVTS